MYKLLLLILMLLLFLECSFSRKHNFDESIIYCSYTEASNIVYGKQCLVEIEIENLTNDSLVWDKVILIGNPDSIGLGYGFGYVQNYEATLGPREKVIKGF